MTTLAFTDRPTPGAPPLVASPKWQLESATMSPNARGNSLSMARSDSRVNASPACQPISMRVRRRTADDAAPLTICIDLTSSADIDPEYLVKRGTAILALARILSSLRPVTIWLGAGLSGGGKADGTSAWFQIDSAPLDLARAAFQISSGGVPRGMLYTFLQKQFGCGGGWPMYDVDRWRRMAPRFLTHWFEGEILFVPPVFTTDDFKKPEVWLERMVKQYGGRGEE